MSNSSLSLNRETLARFLPTMEAIIAFEELFDTVNIAQVDTNEALESEILALYSRAAGQARDIKNSFDLLLSELTTRRHNIDKLRADVDLIKHYLGI